MSTALVVGNIIGISIFLMPASLAPFGLNALTAWLVTGVGCGAIALTFAALARQYPGADGPYDYTLQAFGPAAAFIVMWCYWVSVWVANAAIAMGVVGYLLYFMPHLAEIPLVPPLAGLALLWLFVGVNLQGARASGWVQVGTTVLKLVPQAAVILLGLAILLMHPQAYRAHVPPNPAAWGEVASASALALFSMLGLECAVIAAGRVRDPERNIPRATVGGTLICAAIYLGISVVPMLLIPQSQLAASTAPFADLLAGQLGGRWGSVLAAFVVVSGLGTLNGWTLVIGEVTETMARHGVFPQSLARLNAHGAPARAFVVTGVITSVMLLGNYAGSIAGLFAFLTAMAVNLGLPIYFVAALAVLKFPRASTRPVLWLAAALALGYCLWIGYGLERKPLLWGLVFALAGLPIYLAYAARARRRPLAAGKLA
jgi:APA family basic amino acid/polyamine antiporter